MSFRERREPTDSCEHALLKRKSSVDFDKLPQLAVQPLSDQMLAALSADDIIPEKVFLISIRDSSGQVRFHMVEDYQFNLLWSTAFNGRQRLTPSVMIYLQAKFPVLLKIPNACKQAPFSLLCSLSQILERENVYPAK